nr:MAG TPA: hypothetical protein [Caudoviricetes sp.]
MACINNKFQRIYYSNFLKAFVQKQFPDCLSVFLRT